MSWKGPTVTGKTSRRLAWDGGRSVLETNRLGKGYNSGTLSRAKSGSTKQSASPHLMFNKGMHRSGGTSRNYFRLIGNSGKER